MNTVFFNKLKPVLWFVIILLVSLSFPLQVLFNSPYPSLIPYFLLGGLFFLQYLNQKQGKEFLKNIFLTKLSNASTLINIYIFLFIINTCWQILFNVISPYQGVSAVVVYIFPLAFYYYFKLFLNDKEFRHVLWGIVTASLIGSFYFIYDSYLKATSGTITSYSYKAFQYYVTRSHIDVTKANDARINPIARSFGLLQTHSVSSAWILMGGLAALALTHKRTYKKVIILISALFLIICMNFTSILAYFLIILLFEFDGIIIYKFQLRQILKKMVIVLLSILGLLVAAAAFSSKNMIQRMIDVFAAQGNFLFGTGEGQSKLEMIFGTLNRYGGNLDKYPLSFLFGDGFSVFGMEKGGDIGFIDTMSMFGIPFYFIIVFSICYLVYKSSYFLYNTEKTGYENAIKFSICTILMVFIAEGHYSLWTAKAILPLFFMSVGLFERLTYRKNLSDIA
jgi:hypothetical protein